MVSLVKETASSVISPVQNEWHRVCIPSGRSSRSSDHYGPAGKFIKRKHKHMPLFRVSLQFVNFPGPDLDEFTSGVVLGLTGNAGLPTPPVVATAITTAQVAFRDAIVAAMGGGILLTSIKNDKRRLLVDMLREDASYVQGKAAQDLTLLLSSGYSAISTNRARSPLDTPVILGLENGATTQLILRLAPLLNNKAFEVQTKNGGDWTPAGVFAQGRRITLPGLTPGQMYSVQARGIGGSTGYSGWTPPMSHMVM